LVSTIPSELMIDPEPEPDDAPELTSTVTTAGSVCDATRSVLHDPGPAVRVIAATAPSPPATSVMTAATATKLDQVSDAGRRHHWVGSVMAEAYCVPAPLR